MNDWSQSSKRRRAEAKTLNSLGQDNRPAAAVYSPVAERKEAAATLNGPRLRICRPGMSVRPIGPRGAECPNQLLLSPVLLP